MENNDKHKKEQRRTEDNRKTIPGTKGTVYIRKGYKKTKK